MAAVTVKASVSSDPAKGIFRLNHSPAVESTVG